MKVSSVKIHEILVISKISVKEQSENSEKNLAGSTVCWEETILQER